MIISIFLTIIFLIPSILIFLFADLNDNNYIHIAVMLGTVTIVSLIISANLYFAAIGVYPHLEAQKSKVLALKSEIIRIKKSFYAEGKRPALLIGGSLDNIKQSTNLSIYISKYAKSKANFAYDIAKYKTACNVLPYWIIGSNIAMDCPAIEKINPKIS
ncbi:MAG: hypothetical protein ACYCTB_11915 [bacterium]